MYEFQTVIVGIEPEDRSPWSDELTPTVKNRLPELVQAVLEEIHRAGGHFSPVVT